MTTEAILLIVTPFPGMGELIQRTLEESGLYLSLLTHNPKEALEFAQAMPFDICILDAAVKDYPVSELVNRLRSMIPKVRIIVIPENDELTGSERNNIAADSWISRSYSPAELLDTVKKTQEQSLKPPIPTETPPIGGQRISSDQGQLTSWLEDANQAARHLTRLLLETGIQAALILRDGELWSYAGQFPQPAVKEIASILSGFWKSNALYLGTTTPTANRNRSGGIVRFVHLESTQGRYMLYAALLNKDMVLALTFNSETPLSKIRHQAGYITQALSSTPGIITPAIRTEQTDLKNITAPQPAKISEPLLTVKPTLKPILDDVPPPKPLLVSTYTSGLPTQPPLPEQSEVNPMQEEVLVKQEPGDLFNIPSITIPSGGKPEAEILTHHPILISDNNIQLHVSSELENRAFDQSARQEELAKVQSIQPEAEYNLHTQPDIIQSVQYLNYTCLLVPRMPQHFLNTDLTTHLFEWMGQLCLAYGWRLEHLSTHPDYIQWVAGAPMTTSPADIVNTIRHQTSQRIFNEFPSLAQDNPSGDFWAPAFIISGGSKTIPTHLVKQYIDQIRIQQGLTKPG